MLRPSIYQEKGHLAPLLSRMSLARPVVTVKRRSQHARGFLFTPPFNASVGFTDASSLVGFERADDATDAAKESAELRAVVSTDAGRLV